MADVGVDARDERRHGPSWPPRWKLPQSLQSPPSPQWLRRWTIGRELALLVVAALLPFGVLGVYWAQQDYRSEQARIQARALRLARDVSLEVDQFVADTEALVEALAHVPSVKRAEQPAGNALLAEIAAKYPYYENLYVLDSDGRVLASGGQGGGHDPPPGDRQTYVRQALRAGGTVVTDALALRAGGAGGRHVFVVATPVWDERGAPLGVVAASVNLHRLQEGLRRADLPDQSSLLVVDRGGRVVARRTDPERWVGRSALESSAVRDALRLREGVSEGSFIDGVRRLSGFAPATRVPWQVIVGIPVEEAYGALRRELGRAIARLALAALVAGGAAWLVSRRLTGPIGRLSDAVRAYAAGDLSHRVAAHARGPGPGRGQGPVELVALGATLDRMADALQRQVDELHAAHAREREAGARGLAELRRLHSEFIAVAAHELRTPVAGVKSYAELLLRDDVDLPEATRRQALERLNGLSDRLARLVRSLLGAARIQAGGLEIDRAPFDLTALVARVVEEAAAAAREHDVVLRARPRRLATAMGDAERVEDVLVNLLVNATKYSPPGTSVFVDVLGDERSLEVIVTDQGPGIPEDEQSLVFERFTRGRHVSGGGVGLGLYIARAYVEAMGGAIGVRSTLGKGASLWFRLPRAPSHPVAENLAPPAIMPESRALRMPGTLGAPGAPGERPEAAPGAAPVARPPAETVRI